MQNELTKCTEARSRVLTGRERGRGMDDVVAYTFTLSFLVEGVN